MPLSKPTADRDPIHTRRITCSGYRRDDGLWDIEGHLVDTKTYDFPNHDRGQVKAGEPVHEMWLRLTVDDELVIRDAEAVTEHSPYRICPAITPNFERLKGTQIKSGWRKAVHALVGGVHGCTHLREMLGPIATTAFQTIYPIKARRHLKPNSSPADRPLLIGTCHAYAADSDVVKRLWPAFHNSATAAGTGDK